MLGQTQTIRPLLLFGIQGRSPQRFPVWTLSHTQV